MPKPIVCYDCGPSSSQRKPFNFFAGLDGGDDDDDQDDTNLEPVTASDRPSTPSTDPTPERLSPPTAPVPDPSTTALVPRPHHEFLVAPGRTLRVGVGAGTAGMSRTGAVLWEASLRLAERVRADAGAVAGRRVLELGAGVAALPGQTAACVGAAEVIVTDVGGVVAELDANCARNRDAHGACALRAAELAWGGGGDAERQPPAWLERFRPELLLLADAVYDAGEPAALGALLVRLLARAPGDGAPSRRPAEAWLVNCRTRACARLRPWLRKQGLEVAPLGEQTPSMFAWRIACAAAAPGSVAPL